MNSETGIETRATKEPWPGGQRTGMAGELRKETELEDRIPDAVGASQHSRTQLHLQSKQTHLSAGGEAYVNPAPYFLFVDFKLLILEVTPRRHTSGYICARGSSEQGRALGMWAVPFHGPRVLDEEKADSGRTAS